MYSIKDFMKEPKVQEALEEENIDEIYTLHMDEFGSNAVFTQLTEFFLRCNINPLDYMNYIPKYFLYDSDITELKLSNTVNGIGTFAILKCPNLNKLYIPSSVTFIGSNAIVDCPNLVIECEKGSYTHKWCLDTGRKFNLIK